MNEPGERQGRLTLLVVLAHPDDEIGAVAAMLAQRARGDHVVLCWLTRGELTEAFGPVGTDEVIARRIETGRAAGEILDVETRFLEFPDTAVPDSREAALEVARVITDDRPRERTGSRRGPASRPPRGTAVSPGARGRSEPAVRRSRAGRRRP